VRFYFDPNSISMANGNTHVIFNGPTGSSTAVLRIEFWRSSNVYQRRARLLHGIPNWSSSGWLTIADATHSIEIEWRRPALTRAPAATTFLMHASHDGRPSLGHRMYFYFSLRSVG